ncbi:MAG: VCBS repeat-containing protein [Planctomycetota bacterium]
MLRYALCVAALVPSAFSQTQSFGHDWVTFEPAPGLLAAGAPISSPGDEVDFAAGDLDADGDPDLVVVRKEPYTQSGARTNLLFLNEGGVLTDRTALYAAASDVPGDAGFLTATTDRDVQLVDVDLDGLLDVVTCTALMDGAPKALSHPRVYLNLGSDAGAWQGLLHQDARIPQLVTFGGQPVATHAIEVLAGDVTGDGFPELYLVDHDSGFAGYFESSTIDLEDRLLINDGLGYFTDETSLRLQSLMYTSGFGIGGRIADLNLDGRAEILRGSTGGISDNVQEVSVTYNDPANEGTFHIYQDFYTLSPYAVAAGDLNQDGRIDVVVGDDNADRYVLNTGVDALGRVEWGPATLFDFLLGVDDGFTGQVLIHDLDHDGWPDVAIADEDIDIPQGDPGRRLHLYHNLGGTPGDAIVLREERETGFEPWLGAAGMLQDDLRRTFDVAALDVDGDGWDDLILGRTAGTSVWRNATGDQVCQPDLGFQGPGDATLTVCGDALIPGGRATLAIEHARPDANGLLAYGFTSTQVPFAGGTLVPIPVALAGFTTDDAGKWILPELVSAGGPIDLFAQAALLDPDQAQGFALTNAVRIELLP